MTYSIIGILAAVILIIINWDVLRLGEGRKLTGTDKTYRCFLLGIMAYLITDISWGFLETRHLSALLFIDTEIHVVAMAAAVMLWTKYVASYLERKNAFAEALFAAGRVFLCFEIIVAVINLFYPVLFWLDALGDYHAAAARYVTLAIQVLLFMITSVYTFIVAAKSKGTVRRRHLTVGVFGAAMALLITVQVFYPLLPLYALGYLLGTCLLHSVVMENEKEDYRQVLDLYATSVDYNPHSEESVRFFQIVQNKLHFAAHGHTAAEVIYQRADAEQPFMGLRTFSGDLPVLRDVAIAKNYLNEQELRVLNNLVSGYFDLAEIAAIEHRPMYMRDYIAQLDAVLTSGGRKLLQDAGTVSHQQALNA